MRATHLSFSWIFLSMVFLIACTPRVSPEEKGKHEESKRKVQQAVADWIKKNAMYPGSYKPVSFEGHFDSTVDSDDVPAGQPQYFSVMHTHKIRDRDSVMQVFNAYFLVESDYSVSWIDTLRTRFFTGGAFPPKTQIWMDRFGREMSSQEQFQLNVEQQNLVNDAIEDAKRELEQTVRTGTPEEKEVAREMLKRLNETK